MPSETCPLCGAEVRLAEDDGSAAHPCPESGSVITFVPDGQGGTLWWERLEDADPTGLYLDQDVSDLIAEFQGGDGDE